MALPATTYPNISRIISGVAPIYNNDCILLCDTSTVPTVIELKEIPENHWSTTWRMYVNDNSNNAGTNNIVINAPAGYTVNGSSSITLNTNGSSVILAINGNKSYIVTGGNAGGGGSGGYSLIEDQGVPLPQRSTMNFVGKGVRATDVGGKTQIDVTLKGENYLYVYADSTHSNNYAELLATYALAKTLTPNSQPISNNNRITIIMGAGYYELSTVFVMDSEFIDFVSLTGNCDVIFSGSSTLYVVADNIYIKGINTLNKNFTIIPQAPPYEEYVIENCQGGEGSFGSNINVAGTFINCKGNGAYCFGGNTLGVASGKFINCEGNQYSFGGGGIASGTFTNCTAFGQYSFGGGGTECSGTFTNCIAEASYCFGSNSPICSGKFYNCRGGTESFGGGSNVNLDGMTCKNCFGGTASFGGGTANISAGSQFYDCVGADYSFGGGDSNSATGQYFNCNGGELSFGGAGTADGKFTNCVGGDGSFGGYVASFTTNTASGTFTNCVGGDGSFGGNNGGTGVASGQFTNCVGEIYSFGGGATGTLLGQLYFCRLQDLGATFQTVTGGGRTIYCVDGNDNINNQ